MKKIIENLSILEIRPYIKNSKTSKNIEMVKRSIEEFWYISPIIIDDKNEILAWHSRYFALKELGYSEIEVVKVTELSEKEKREFRILDNKISEFNSWDLELLRDEIKDLDIDFMEDFFEFDLQKFTINLTDDWKDMNVTKDDIEKMETNLEKISETKEVSRIKMICPHCLEEFEV